MPSRSDTNIMYNLIVRIVLQTNICLSFLNYWPITGDCPFSHLFKDRSLINYILTRNHKNCYTILFYPFLGVAKNSNKLLVPKSSKQKFLLCEMDHAINPNLLILVDISNAPTRCYFLNVRTNVMWQCSAKVAKVKIFAKNTPCKDAFKTYKTPYV